MKSTRKLHKTCFQNQTSSSVYRIHCSCIQVYIRITKCTINTRIEEHKRHSGFFQCEKSLVGKQALINWDHRILYDELSCVPTPWSNRNLKAQKLLQENNRHEHTEVLISTSEFYVIPSHTHQDMCWATGQQQ